MEDGCAGYTWAILVWRDEEDKEIEKIGRDDDVVVMTTGIHAVVNLS